MCLGKRWHHRVLSHSSNLFHGPLLHAVGCQSFLPPPFEILTRIFRIFLHHHYHHFDQDTTHAGQNSDKSPYDTLGFYNKQKSQKKQCLYASIFKVIILTKSSLLSHLLLWSVTNLPEEPRHNSLYISCLQINQFHISEFPQNLI